MYMTIVECCWKPARAFRLERGGDPILRISVDFKRWRQMHRIYPMIDA